MIRNLKQIVIRTLDVTMRLINKSIFLIPFTHKRYIKRKFLQQHGYHMNFKKPITFSEKIQWIKLYGSVERYAKYVDKNEVRGFVKEKIGDNYLIPKIAVYNDVNDIDIDSLPEKFVIKATHGSGWNMIVRDKSKLDWDSAKWKIQKWIKANYFYISGEKNYKKIKGRVLIEELLENTKGVMKEYKFYCYHGKPCYVVAVEVTESNEREKGFYDLNWNWLNMNINGLPDKNSSVNRPYYFNEMTDISQKLSKGFAFVRVDLYYSQGKIFVGELTFTPNNGFGKFSDIMYDKMFGKYLSLSEVK